jgi:hypothetical protein
MSHVLLSHLSRDNNNPELVKDLFTTFAEGTEVIVASRYAETPVFRVTAAGVAKAETVKAAAPSLPAAAAKVKPATPEELKAAIKADVRLHPKWKPTPLGF